MSINSLLTAIETAFKAGLTTTKTLEQFPGPFTPQVIVDRGFTAPAVFFGCSGAQEPRHEDERILNQFGVVKAAKFTVVTVGKHAKTLAYANREAMLLAEQLCMLLYKQDFALEDVRCAYNVRIEALATARDKRSGHLCFWRVTWWHGVAINADQLLLDWQNLPTFDGYDADHFEVDADTATDTPKMESQENYP